MRGKKAPVREILPDPKYNSIVIAKFINYIMLDGQKTIAQGIIYDVMNEIDRLLKEKKIEGVENIKNAQEFLDVLLEKVTPMVEVKSRRVGGSNYQIPLPVRGNRRYYLAFTWLIDAARARKGKAMYKRLLDEMLDAFHGTGATIKKKEDVYRMAEANRAFAHLARF
jgi:small subunit ribosomal protein S7